MSARVNLGGPLDPFEREPHVDPEPDQRLWDDLTLAEQRALAAHQLDRAIGQIARFCGKMLQNIGAWRNHDQDL